MIAKSLLTIASIGITTTTLASTADASEGYGPREKKPISINNNIVEYNDGTYKYQSRPKLIQHLNILSLDMIITSWNIMTVHSNMVHVHNLINQQRKLRQLLKRTKLIQAQNLVREFEKTHTVSAHRKAQKAVNLVSFEYNVKKMILQERIDQVLKQGLVR